MIWLGATDRLSLHWLKLILVARVPVYHVQKDERENSRRRRTSSTPRGQSALKTPPAVSVPTRAQPSPATHE